MTRIEIAKKAAEASNIKYNFICPFCEAKMICRKSEFSRHKNFCKKNPNNKLKDKDREQYIIEQINPKEFWKYSEKFDKLYRIL